MAILASALLLGLAVPLLVDRLRTIHYLDTNAVVGFFSSLLPVGILFYGLAMLYKFAPRRPVKFRRVWLAALLGTLFLKFGTHLFDQYLASFTNFNALYGAFATVMGLLLLNFVGYGRTRIVIRFRPFIWVDSFPAASTRRFGQGIFDRADRHSGD